MQETFLRLIFGDRGFECCEKIYSLHTRFPKIFPGSSVKQAIHFLSHLPETFLGGRVDSYIFRLVLAQYRLLKEIGESSIDQTQLFSKVLNTYRGTYGLVIAVSNLDKYDSFKQEHILQGIQHLLSGVRTVQDSFFSFAQEQTHFFYLEIKKVRGGFFSASEIEKLDVSLSKTLMEKIERAFKPIVLPDVEENLFKQIRQLSRELTNLHDIPQIMISFCEYSEHKVTFIVIVVRVLGENPIPPSAFVSQSPSKKIGLEKALVVDYLEKKYPKEASIFRVQLNPSLCTHEKKVNLRAARQHIKKILENAFGQVRDFNGGLIIKEDEQLQKIKYACKELGVSSLHLEDLFYEIQPTYMRAFITTHTCINLLQLLQRIMQKPIPRDQKHCYETFSSESTEIIIVKTDQKHWLTQITATLLASHRQIGYTSLNKGGIEYLCFFEQCVCEKQSLIERIKRDIQALSAAPATDSNTTLRLNLQGGDPSSLNPRLASDIHCHSLCSLLFEGLMRLNHAGDPEPALAKSIDISPSGLEYIFYLRTSAWSNGEEVSAYDFERSWKKALMESVPSFLCPRLFYYIKNARLAREEGLSLSEIGVRARDSKTLCVTLEAPCEYFLHLVATPLFFPLLGDSEEPKDFNGPFYVEEWDHDHSITLSRNPFYWNSKKLKFNGIKFSMEMDVHRVYAKFQKGELDIIGDPLSPLNPSILEIEQSKLFSKEVSRVFWVHCNRRVFPLQHKLVRQALNIALNRKRIATEVFYKQIPHSSPLPLNYAHSQLDLEGDPELANAKFEQALKELKLDRSSFPSLELIHSNLAFEKSLAAELKWQWKESLGIQLVTKELSWCEFSSALEKGDFQLGGLFRRDLFNHPQFYLSFFRCSPMNPHSLESLEYERLFNQIDRDKNDLESTKQIEQLLIDEAPVLPLICQVYFGRAQDWVRGVSWSANGCINLNQAYFDDENYSIDS